MRILILGGTGFVGRAVRDVAVAAGHDVTLFNRGVTPVLGHAPETARGNDGRERGLGADGRPDRADETAHATHGRDHGRSPAVDGRLDRAGETAGATHGRDHGRSPAVVGRPDRAGETVRATSGRDQRDATPDRRSSGGEPTAEVHRGARPGETARGNDARDRDHATADETASGRRVHETALSSVTTVIGDRTTPGGLAALGTGTWDIAVDTWSAAPIAVHRAATALRDRVDRFVYISSRSVYAQPTPAGATEDAPVVDAGSGGYAADKRGGELAALDAFGRRAMLARAGLILGPYENVGRLPWWLQRIARGGDFLAPGPADLPIQYVDVRDLAAFVLAQPAGTYDIVGPTTMAELIDACVAVTGADARPRWTAPEKLTGVRPWTELPIWLPPGPDHDFMHGADASRAHAAGLRHRPVIDTVRDTWTWMSTLDGPVPQRADRPAVGLDPAVEAALLSPDSG